MNNDNNNKDRSQPSKQINNKKKVAVTRNPMLNAISEKRLTKLQLNTFQVELTTQF